MHSRLLLPTLLAAAVTVAFAADPPAAEVFDPTALDALRAKKGQVITIEATVLATGTNKAGTHRYLNFTQDFRKSLSLVFVVAKNPQEFTGEKLAEWKDKRIRATGPLSEHNGNLQMMIDKWEQISAVEAAK